MSQQQQSLINLVPEGDFAYMSTPRDVDISKGAHNPYAHIALADQYRTTGSQSSDDECSNFGASLPRDDLGVTPVHHRRSSSGVVYPGPGYSTGNTPVPSYRASPSLGSTPTPAISSRSNSHTWAQQSSTEPVHRRCVSDGELAFRLPPAAAAVPSPTTVASKQRTQQSSQPAQREHFAHRRQPSFEDAAPVHTRSVSEPCTQFQSQRRWFHAPLERFCEYLPFPEVLETPEHWPAMEHRTVDCDGTTVRAFIGQVRFETKAEQIAYLIEYVSGVVPAYVASHRNGCFVAHFYSWEDCTRAVAYHQSIYFDLSGAWIARDAAGKAAIGREVAAVAQGPRKAAFRKCKLPGRAMVIESFTDADPGTSKRLEANGLGTTPSDTPVHTRASSLVAHHYHEEVVRHVRGASYN